MIARRNPVLSALILMPALAGCGNGLAKVSGTVKLDDQPIVGSPQMYGTVTFCRESGGTPAVGIIDASGRYTLSTGSRSGVEPGTYLVGIAVKKIMPPVNRDAMPQPVLITPPKYASVTQSGLREEVQPGSNTFDFAIASERKR